MKRNAVPSTEWMQGRDLAWLKSVAAIFAIHDEGLVLGGFTRTSERTVADWDASGELRLDLDSGAAAVVQRTKSARRWVDFAGEGRALITPMSPVIRKIAGPLKAVGRLIADVPHPFWFEGWMESDADRTFAESHGLECWGVKVRASSELWGLFGPSGDTVAAPCNLADWPTIHKLMDGLAVKAAIRAVVARPPEMVNHYSVYNVKKSWTAAVLRGYGPPGRGGLPDFIANPVEMLKKWKEANPEKLGWVIQDSPLRAMYPELEPLIAAVPGKPHRIRLMNLAPGGGELLRHADMEPSAGTRDGCLCRVHIPLITNPDVRFRSWRLDGTKINRHMAVGEAWYLDTRKPHTAINGGDAARLHLVIDMESSPAFRRLLGVVDEPTKGGTDLFGNPVR